MTHPERSPAGARPIPKEPSLYFNRELSWLAFNERVLEEAADSHWPLLERLKFLAITFSNLDEFFMIRVSGLHEQLEQAEAERSPDGLTPRQQLARIREVVRRLLKDATDLPRAAAPPSAGGARHPDPRLEVAGQGSAGAGEGVLPRVGVPGAHPAGGGPRTSLPLHLQPLAVPGGRGRRSGERRAALRAG